MNPPPDVGYGARVKLILAAFSRRRGCDHCGHGLAEHLIAPDAAGRPRSWCLHDISGAPTPAGRLHIALQDDVTTS